MGFEVVDAEACPSGLEPSSSAVKNFHGALSGSSGCVQFLPKSALSTRWSTFTVRVRVRVRVGLRVRVRVRVGLRVRVRARVRVGLRVRVRVRVGLRVRVRVRWPTATPKEESSGWHEPNRCGCESGHSWLG